MSDQNHAPTARSKPPPPGEEEAGAVLKLGEFEGVDTLTLSEASLVINALMAKRRKDRKDRNETDVLNKTLEYLDSFARFKQKENVEAVERLLSAHKELTKFERAQIGRSSFSILKSNHHVSISERVADWVVPAGSLCCDSADECKTLMPSLADKISDEDLQELLDEMAKLMST
jgi:DNA-directed RNA polymerase II subunit RPB4